MPNKKNVIWILVDQMRADAMSCSGDPNISTPNLDLLSAQGVHFERAVSGVPLCSPFRGCLLTSQYAHKSSVPGLDYSLDPSLPTIVDVFNENNYDTLYYGKWHLDGDRPRKGTNIDQRDQIVTSARRGRFKTWVGYENINSQFDVGVHGHDGNEHLPWHRLPGFETDSMTDLLINKLDGYGMQCESGVETPFFAVLSLQPPHNPYTAPPSFMRHNPQQLQLRPNVPPYHKLQQQVRRELAGYYALIENIDWNVGRIRDALRRNHLDLDTHIMFFSDHGDMHGSHGMFRKANPLEESIRIPLIIGGERPMGYYGRGCKRSDYLVNHVDIAPTTLGLCGIDPPNWMVGFDYSFERVPYLRKPKCPPPTSAYLQSIIPTKYDNSIDKPYRGIVTTDNYKYICLDNSEWLMFDLINDPYELINLAHSPQHIAKRYELNCILRDWVTKTGDNFVVPVLDYCEWPTEYVTYPDER